MSRPRAIILYHYFHPDDVVSARHFSDLARGLVQRGWSVTAHPCDLPCRETGQRFPKSEVWHDVTIQRVRRPAFRQSSNLGRSLNAISMIASWGWRGLVERRRSNEVVIVGTDPIFSVLGTIPWHLRRPKCRVVHWCFDLYPEAAIADGMVGSNSRMIRPLKQLMAFAYRRCGLIADLGLCMRDLLKSYRSQSRAVTLTPWALVEPSHPPEPDLTTRQKLFGDARIGLLYSGSFGRAHSFTEFLQLARMLRDEPIGFCFAGRGNRMDELKAAVQPEDHNIRFAGFAPEAELEKRLGACDMHLVSLRPEWTGTVVPSKFFGALATGRGVIFGGSPDSAIARWIDEFNVGQVLTPTSISEVANSLRMAITHPDQLSSLKARCFETYHNHFSRKLQIDRWDQELRSLIASQSK